MNGLAVEGRQMNDRSNLCCWGKVHVRHAGLVVTVFAFMAALFDVLFIPAPHFGVPVIICDLAAGIAGIYAFCAGRAWAWLPLMIINILKTVVFAFFAFLSLIALLTLNAINTEDISDDGKQFARIVLIIAAAVTAGYVLAGCLFAWFARLTYRTFTWQKSAELPRYHGCPAEKTDV